MARNGINVNGLRSTRANLRRFATGIAGGGSRKWIIGVGANYGAYVEFGTSRMKAQPYLFPAAKKVIRTQLPMIERKANDVAHLVKLVAHAIEAEAKRNAPVDTGNLRASIEAFPAESLI